MNKSAKVPIVEGYRFRVQSINVESEYYHGGYGLANLSGPTSVRVDMEASSLDYTKEDWGELMDALTSGKTLVVVSRE